MSGDASTCVTFKEEGVFPQEDCPGWRDGKSAPDEKYSLLSFMKFEPNLYVTISNIYSTKVIQYEN